MLKLIDCIIIILLSLFIITLFTGILCHTIITLVLLFILGSVRIELYARQDPH